MQSEFREKDKTLGSKILETAEKHLKSSPVEAMELAHEGGKSYMRELINVIENHRNVIEPYYIQVFCTRERMIKDRPAIIFRFFARRTAPPMHVEQDLWYINNAFDKLELLWSLPQQEMLDIVLNDPDADPQLRRWIKIYKEK